jgi:hypothetical protein
MTITAVTVAVLLAGTAPEPKTESPLERDARAFVERWLSLEQREDGLDEVMALYADEVEFHGGPKGKAAVTAEKKAFGARWPRRKYQLLAMIAQPLADQSVEVRVVYAYDLERRSTDRRGRDVRTSLDGGAEARLILRRVEGSFVIVRETDADALSSDAEVSASEDGRSAKLRTGELQVRGDDTWRADRALLLNGVLISEGPGLYIETVLRGARADYALVLSDNGGTACPFSADVFEIRGRGTWRSSSAGCTDDPEGIEMMSGPGGPIEVETPFFAPHPDAGFSRAWFKNAEVRVWKDGRLVPAGTRLQRRYRTR